MQVNGAATILQNRYVGGCTVLWSLDYGEIENLVLTIASNHPKAVSFRDSEGFLQRITATTPVSHRPLQYRFFAAEIGHPDHKFPIILEQRGLFNVPIAVMTKPFFERSEKRATFLAGGLLSLWLIVIGTGVITFFFSMKVIYLGYGLLALASGLMVFAKTGFGQSLLWFEFPGLTDIFVSLSAPLASMAICLLLVVSLDSLIRAPKSFLAIVIISLLALVATGLRFLVGWHEFENIAHLVLLGPFIFFLIMTLWHCYGSKPVETTLLALAIVGLISGVLISNMSHVGLIENSLFAVRASEVGAGFDLLVAWILIAVKVYADNRRSRELANEMLELRAKREVDLSRQVAEQTESLRKVNAEKTRLLQDFLMFSRYLTHDVRNPLTHISNVITLIEAEIGVKSSLQSRLRSMSGSIRRISNLFDDWLIVQRMSLGFHVPTLTQIDLTKFISDVMSELPYKDEVNLDFKVDPMYSTVTWDRGLIKRVVHNLLDNAKRYADSESGFKLVLTNDDALIHIEVIDFGPIPYEKICSRLWRQKSDSVTARPDLGGSGLGTAFINYAIKLHKGEIVTAESREGKGLRVSITLSARPAI